MLIKSTTSKVIFTQSVTRVDDFVDTVDILRDHLKQCEDINPELTTKFKEYFLRPPYVLYSFFLKLSNDDLSMKDTEHLDKCLQMLK